MKLADLISFRSDLLFNGAVQIGWLESDLSQANKAAEHYIFHGPDYHGVSQSDFEDTTHKLVDTSYFTLDILERLNGKSKEWPFVLAIAGYGTGKSHLGLTLATLLSEPNSNLANKITENINMADATIGGKVQKILNETKQPYLVIALNGMQDFDLNNEIIRQTIKVLKKHKLDTSTLEDLRPRFITAINFTESFFTSLREDFIKTFGENCKIEYVVDRLKSQNERTFRDVSEIYETKMGTPIHAVGKESLHDFIRVTKETYCGPGKPFSGILIIFDEFGRYLEFSVQKPHIAGSGALQQLFECVQENRDSVFLLSFIQYELKAYISRVAPELREDLNRYVTRYDAIPKVRLSTNLETLMANLLEKKAPEKLQHQYAAIKESPYAIQLSMLKWFPEIKNHTVWKDSSRFERIIFKGCWPLHPLSTWMLYKLSSVGKSLQQRSALSFLAEAYDSLKNFDFLQGNTITPVYLCSESMINEFLNSERYGQQGATAHAYESIVHKYQHEFSDAEKAVLKSIMITAKIGIKISSKEDYNRALAMFSGVGKDAVVQALRSLESEYAVLNWNEQLRQYEFEGDAVPKRVFIAHLDAKVSSVNSKSRADIFSNNYAKWFKKDKYNIDFGSENNIATREWNYNIIFSNMFTIKAQVANALKEWTNAINVDEEKGQLIYCYLGPESDLETTKQKTSDMIFDVMKKQGLDCDIGAPIFIVILHDIEGKLGNRIAEYWILKEQMNEEEVQKYSSFVKEKKNQVKEEIENLFSILESQRHVLFASNKKIKMARLNKMLTYLFNLTYYNRIPFPFDGFHTAKGNAAKDCQMFTAALFRGDLDRDWIAVCNVKQRNRAYEVFDESWGIFNKDGSVKLIPSNKEVKNIIELMKEKIDETVDSQKPINLGKLMRLICGPPYGCNIASGGLLLALLIGYCKNNLQLITNKKPISIEAWVRDAYNGNFLNLKYLDETYVLGISQQTISEWDKLLNEWEIEKNLWEQVKYRRKASDLEKRIPVPQLLYYKYQHLYKESSKAVERLSEYERKVKATTNQLNEGIVNKDIIILTSVAMEIDEMYQLMKDETDEWKPSQLKEVKNNLSNVRFQIKQNFGFWLKRQTIENIEQLGKFRDYMKNIVSNKLLALGFLEESNVLIKHIEAVENHVRLIAKIRQLEANINNLIYNNKITESTPIRAINNWMLQASDYSNQLNEVAKQNKKPLEELKIPLGKIQAFNDKCKEQISYYQSRVNRIFNIDVISSLSDIANWRAEIAALIIIYEGDPHNIEDLKLVQKQLDLLESHLKIIDNDSLNEKEFMDLCNQCKLEIEKEFSDDVPPLDNELIYAGIINTILSKREEKANDWMKRNVPDFKIIPRLEASKAIEIKMRLLTMPPILSIQQVRLANTALEACEKRLDELEIEGLLAKFEALSEENKKIFINRISGYTKVFQAKA